LLVLQAILAQTARVALRLLGKLGAVAALEVGVAEFGDEELAHLLTLILIRGFAHGTVKSLRVFLALHAPYVTEHK